MYISICLSLVLEKLKLMLDSANNSVKDYHSKNLLINVYATRYLFKTRLSL